VEDVTNGVGPEGGEPHERVPGARLALRVLQLGALAIVFAVVPWREFELDRFFVPKELVLHLTAVMAAFALVRGSRRFRLERVDLLLAGYVLLSVVSAVIATNGWSAFRAVAISASGVTIFWAARAVARAGLARPLLSGLAVAVVLGTATSLVQAYGVESDYFSINRAPGGTFGNRNFIAHLAAFGLPLVLFRTLTARHWYTFLAGGAGAMLVVGSLVLTRSRAGWLAFGAVLLVLAAGMLFSRALRAEGRLWARLVGVVVLAGAGAIGAVLVPNALQWRSDNPYLESLRGVANYQEGSGAGRLVQYRQSMSMAATAPLLGVGPGNWAVRYPEHAAPRDPSLSGGTPGTTSNPWPSSDWVAFVSERGVPAALLLALALGSLVFGALRRVARARDRDDALAALSILAVVGALAVAGLFDAVLLLAWPTFFAWAALGALAPPGADVAPGDVSAYDTAAGTDRFGVLRVVALVFALAAAVAGSVRSTAQLTAMGIYANRSDATWLVRAAHIDPGNYRLRVRLARPASGLARSERCAHASAAHAMFPSAQEARNLHRRCPPAGS
jgi:O-antigen ligase